jgi:hypothetical protein
VRSSRGETNYFSSELGLAQARLNEELASDPAADERCLIQRALPGDPDAVAPLSARYRRRLFRAAGRSPQRVRAPEFVSGAIQFCIWLTRIVVNAALMALRRKRARPETSLDESQHGSFDDWPACGRLTSEPRASLRRDGSHKPSKSLSISFQRECIPHFAPAY